MNKTKSKITEKDRWIISMFTLMLVLISILAGHYLIPQKDFSSNNQSNYTLGAIDGYNYRNAEQLNELTNYNMTFVYYNLNNQTFKIKLVPEVFCK